MEMLNKPRAKYRYEFKNFTVCSRASEPRATEIEDERFSEACTTVAGPSEERQPFFVSSKSIAMSLENAISALSTQLNTVLSRLEQIEGKIASGASASAPAAASSGSGEGPSPAVAEYQALIDQYVVPFVQSAKTLEDPLVAKQAEFFLEATNKQRDFLSIVSKSKKPDDTTFQKLLGPTSELMGQITGVKESKESRSSKNPNNLATVAEGVSALGWVCIAPTPGPHVAESRGSAEFYSNRILKEFKGNNQNQVDFVTHFVNFLKELQVFVKKNHTTGLSWNPRGGDAASASSAAPAGAPSAPAPAATAAPTKSAGDITNVFAALNKGDGVTSGLKKVTNDMKSKNNPNKSSVVPSEIKPVAAAATKTAAKPTVTKPPKFSLEGNKWVVEYQVGNKSLVISETEPKHTVYIYKCQNSVIKVQGKVNAITLDDCSKTSVIFEDVVASFEVVNCKSVEVQVEKSVPSIAVDKTSGIQIFLAETSLHTEIVSSKSDSMNVLLPDPVNGFEEKPIPEQYKTVVKNRTLVTEINSHV
ncbi:hypothetical protein PROFUN_03042 [Planoprotostelium fungivorum]|uniref:C-CAP/cofactor C-like domain-containing protein n=1 Tax=Planoprotostelium fungivorum TaxID=1890364 RepID=A0A2P6NXE9_9EUKA|nr:hypothetical protein PROFUN_03042 [Planoprotostelium fungivorum]